jgi:4-amino-4-deoxy-L-arabinose transferase-like glycosyltransferase
MPGSVACRPKLADPTGHRDASERWRGCGGVLLVVLVFAAIVASHFDVIPIWDAKAYLYCIERAVQKPFDLLNFRCGGHPSIVYALLLSLSQYISPWNPPLMYATNAVLGIASIAAFHALLRMLFPNSSRAERVLLAALYGLAPVFVAHAIFLNVDYAATAFYVLFLFCLFARRFWMGAPARSRWRSRRKQAARPSPPR